MWKVGFPSSSECAEWKIYQGTIENIINWLAIQPFNWNQRPGCMDDTSFSSWQYGGINILEPESITYNMVTDRQKAIKKLSSLEQQSHELHDEIQKTVGELNQ